MKKNNRNVGLIYMAIGIIGLVVSTQIDNGLGSILFGMSFGAMGSASMLLWKYFYWSRPANAEVL